MDKTNAENDKYFTFSEAVNRFERYENAINGDMSPDVIKQYQNECLNCINDMIICGNSEPYSTALFFIREDLLRQMKKIESQSNQISFNGITITRISNPSCEPLLPSLRHNFTAPTKCEPEIKKRKQEPTNPGNSDNSDKLRNVIKNTLILPQSTGLAEIAGLEEAKKMLKEAVLLPIQFPHLFTGGRKKWNKALLYGPPGTGKTFLAHCLAAEIKVPLYCVSSSDLWSCYVGESEKLIRMLFNHCQESKKQCIIFIDEIDSICRVRNSKESELERRFKNQLLTQLSEMDRNPNNTIFFLACTNCPWDLDPAFIRRFQRRIYIPLPDRQTRLEIFKIQSKSPELMVSEQWEKLSDKTEGWSGSDITDLVNCAMYQPIKELQTADRWIITDDCFYMPAKDIKVPTLKISINDVPSDRVKVRQVKFEDFNMALNFVTKTVSEKSLKQFEQFNESCGSLKV